MPADRFIRKGKTQFIFLPSVAGYVAGGTGTGPTTAEVTAGTNLSLDIADIAGWRLRGNDVATPALGSAYDANIPGPDSTDDSSLTMYADEGADATRAAQAKGTAGFMYVLRAGTVTGGKRDLFPIKIRSVGDEFSMGNDPARYVIEYSITDQPLTDLAAPSP